MTRNSEDPALAGIAALPPTQETFAHAVAEYDAALDRILTLCDTLDCGGGVCVCGIIGQKPFYYCHNNGECYGICLECGGSIE